MRPMLLAALRLAAAAALAPALTPALAGETPPALAATYVCDGGAVLQATYINPETGPGLAVVGWAGKLIPMRVGPSGSGVRYIAFDEQASYRWWTKGDTGTLLFLEADHTASEEVVLGGCRQVAQ